MSITLAQLRDAVLERADQINGSFRTDARVNRLINVNAARLHALVVESDEDFAVNTYAFSVAAPANNAVDLPSDFLALRGVDRAEPGSATGWIDVEPFNLQARNSPGRLAAWSTTPIVPRYKLFGAKLVLLPATYAPGSYQIWYSTKFVDLASDGSVLPDAWDIQHWSEFIILGAAADLAAEEESDPSYLLGRQQQLEMQIRSELKGRDKGRAAHPVDVCGYGHDG